MVLTALPKRVPSIEDSKSSGGRRTGFTKSWFSWFAGVDAAIRADDVFVVLADIDLVPFVNNDIVHGLGQIPTGYHIIKSQVVKADIDVYRSAPRTELAASSFHNVNFDTIITDDGNRYSVTNFDYTVPVDGKYRLSVANTWKALNDAKAPSAIFKNGTEICRGVSVRGGSSSSDTSSIAASVERLVKNQLITGRALHNDGAVRDITTSSRASRFNRFQVELVKTLEDDQVNNPTPQTTLRLITSYAHTVSLKIF